MREVHRDSQIFIRTVKRAIHRASWRCPLRIAAVAEEFIDIVDGRPEDRDGGGDDEGADHHRGDRLEPVVAVGMLLVGGLAGQAHENFDDDAVGHIRGGVDAVGEQGRAVADDPDAGLQYRQKSIGGKADVDRQDTLFESLVGGHNAAHFSSSTIFQPPFFLQKGDAGMVGQVELDGGDRHIAGGKGVDIGVLARDR